MLKLVGEVSKEKWGKVFKSKHRLLILLSIQASWRYKANTSIKVIAVDLGIKIPAVCCTAENVKFPDNRRMNKYIRRYQNFRKKELENAKKLNAIKKSKDKEQRWMKDPDHKISREIVDFAIKHNVGIIHLEKLANIRKQTRKSRKNNHSLSN